MRKLDHVWTYACIDLDESVVEPQTVERQMEVCSLVAQMAVDAGVDILESGTPMMYGAGYESIERLRRVIGPDFPLVADLKAQDGCEFFFNLCKKHGADYATVCVVNNDGGLKAALAAKETCGIKVIADLFATPAPQLVERAKECEAMGADVIQLHFGYDENRLNIYPGRRDSDYVKEVAEAIHIPLFVVANEREDVERAVRDGADGILFGFVLKDNSRQSFENTRDFVEMVREFDKKYNS